MLYCVVAALVVERSPPSPISDDGPPSSLPSLALLQCCITCQARIETLGYGHTDRTQWHVIRLSWPQPRGGIRSITILSLHIDSDHAKKPVAGPRAVAATLDDALVRSPEIEFVTGDCNGARLAGMR